MDDIKYSNTHHQHEHSRTNYDDQLDYGTPASDSDVQVTLMIDDSTQLCGTAVSL